MFIVTEYAALRICILYANNPALEDFVIQNHYSEFLSMYTKTVHVSIKDLRIYAQISNR